MQYPFIGIQEMFWGQSIIHYEKKGCFATGLATQFLGCIGHLQLTVYMVQFIITQLWVCRNNSCSTTMQPPYEYNHNVMLMSFFIHPSNFNTWHYEDFLRFFWNIDIHHPLWLFLLNGFGLWHVAQSKIAMWNINWIWKQIYMYLRRLVRSHR